jgi:hypothetical protein
MARKSGDRAGYWVVGLPLNDGGKSFNGSCGSCLILWAKDAIEFVDPTLVDLTENHHSREFGFWVAWY